MATTRTRNVSQYMLLLAVCLVVSVTFKGVKDRGQHFGLGLEHLASFKITGYFYGSK